MLKNRGNNTEGVKSFEEFKKIDDAEFSQEGEYKQQINECLKLADITIENNGTVDELKKKVEDYLFAI